MPPHLIPGPKGVINDWRRFKQLETEQRQEQRREMERLIKKLSMTCRSHLDDEADKQKQKELQEKINGKVGSVGQVSQLQGINVKSCTAKL